jgi:vancomycin resistance protein YoaR
MFDDPMGTDAAVFTPDGDFRWRNDTAEPIEIRASLDRQANTVTVSLWGSHDGRITQVSEPVICTVRGTPDVWTFDPRSRRMRFIKNAPAQLVL